MLIQPIGSNYKAPKQSRPAFGMQIKFTDADVIRRFISSVSEAGGKIKKSEVKKSFETNARAKILTLLEGIVEHNSNPANHIVDYGHYAEIKRIDLVAGAISKIITSSDNKVAKGIKEITDNLGFTQLAITTKSGKVDKCEDVNIPAAIQNAEIKFLKEKRGEKLLDTLIEQIPTVKKPDLF